MDKVCFNCGNKLKFTREYYTEYFSHDVIEAWYHCDNCGTEHSCRIFKSKEAEFDAVKHGYIPGSRCFVCGAHAVAWKKDMTERIIKGKKEYTCGIYKCTHCGSEISCKIPYDLLYEDVMPFQDNGSEMVMDVIREMSE